MFSKHQVVGSSPTEGAIFGKEQMADLVALLAMYLTFGALMWFAMFDTYMRTGRNFPLNTEKLLVSLVVCSFAWPFILLIHIINHKDEP